MIAMEIQEKSHNFTVKIKSPEERKICYGFSRDFIEYDLQRKGGNYVRQMKRVYATSNSGHTEFRFMQSTLPDFLKFLKNHGYTEGKDYKFTPCELYEPAAAKFTVFDKWTDLPDQKPILDKLHVPQPVTKPSRVLITVQTGKGKTYTALRELSKRNHRWINICKPAYMEKWWEDIKKTYDMDMNRVLMVAGSKSLKALLQLDAEGQADWDIAIVSTKTMLNWLKEYEELGKETLDLGYACLPENFFEHLKAGTRLNDEVHLELHFQIKLDCYTHVPNSISLSATYSNDNPFLERMMKLAYPISTRLKDIQIDKYADAYPVFYKASDSRHLRTTELNSNNYSHIAFEKSIMRHKQWRENYLRMIGDIVQNTYIGLTRPKKVAAVFAASIAMCTLLKEYLSQRFPGKVVKRYVEDDSVDNVYSCDILVTTVLSAGTALDIPDLVAVYLTIAINSTQANIQTFGRLRKLADHKTEFYYFVCMDVAKHCEYHDNKLKMLKVRAKSVREYHSGVTI